jgi:sugar-specific transcriptional regulator TrmB
MTNPETLLKELGLTEYESKAYLVLVARGELTAERVSVMARIPLPRVYDTMSALSQRGLVIVTKTRPQKFSAISPEEILKLVKEDEQKKLNEKFKKMEEIMPQILNTIEKTDIKKYNDEPDTLSYVKRRVSVETMWNEIHRRARKSVILFAGDLYWLYETRSLLKRTIGKGVSYKIIASKKTDDMIKRSKTISSLGAKIKYNKEVGQNKSIPIRGAVIDGKWTVLFQHQEPDYTKTGSERIDTEKQNDFTTLIISNKLISNVFSSYFDVLWKTGNSPTAKK